MPTPVKANLTAAPAIPLNPDLRAAYQDLYNQYESAIENTADPGVLEALNASQFNVDNILTKDAMYRIEATTDLCDALLKQIKDTNNDLTQLQKQIQAIAGGVATFGGILGAISKVMSLLPAL